MLRYRGRVTLQPVQKSDLETFSRILNKAKVRRYMIQEHPLTQQDELDWFEAEVQNNDDKYVFTIKYHRNIVGVISLEAFTRTRGLLGIWVDNEYWGDNIGYIATSLLVNYAFNKLDFHRVEAEAVELNKSNQTLQNLGFAKEGERREAFYYDGDHYSVNLYGLLQKNWAAEDHPQPNTLP